MYTRGLLLGSCCCANGYLAHTHTLCSAAALCITGGTRSYSHAGCCQHGLFWSMDHPCTRRQHPRCSQRKMLPVQATCPSLPVHGEGGHPACMQHVLTTRATPAAHNTHPLSQTPKTQHTLKQHGLSAECHKQMADKPSATQALPAAWLGVTHHHHSSHLRHHHCIADHWHLTTLSKHPKCEPESHSLHTLHTLVLKSATAACRNTVTAKKLISPMAPGHALGPGQSPSSYLRSTARLML